MFLVECKSYLPGLDSRYRAMITRRTHVLRGKTCVDGKAHLLCHRDNLLDDRWSWDSPAPANIEAVCTQRPRQAQAHQSETALGWKETTLELARPPTRSDQGEHETNPDPEEPEP